MASPPSGPTSALATTLPVASTMADALISSLLTKGTRFSAARSCTVSMRIGANFDQSPTAALMSWAPPFTIWRVGSSNEKSKQMIIPIVPMLVSKTG